MISENDWCNFTSKNATRNSEAYGQVSMWRPVLRSRDVTPKFSTKLSSSELAADVTHQVDYFRNHHGGGFLKDKMVQYARV